MDLVEFLRTVVTGNQGWFCLAKARISDDEKRTKESWTEQFFSWPDEVPNILNTIKGFGNDYDIYFSPYLFSEPSSRKELAIPGRTIVADLDEADILTIQLNPTVLVETSDGRHQGYWILKEPLDTEKHETLSKQLTYSIPRCDKSGWFLGKKVRVPETYNHKYNSGPQYIRVVAESGRLYTTGELEHLVTVTEMYGNQKIDFDEDLAWIDTALNQEDGPQELLSRIRNSIPTVVAKYNIESRDRSAALWALMMALFRAGMSRDKIFFIAYHSPNNKFKDLRYGGLRELGKDVLRAELATKMLLPDIKAKINSARKIGDDPIDKLAYISKLVREHLDKLGSFIHAADDSAWYIRSDTGRPILIGSRSEHLLRLLESLFGINAAQKESSFVNHHLDSMVADLPITGKTATLSYYEHSMRMFMLHTGRRDILVVTKDGIRRETNGYQGIIFPWTTGNSIISPEYRLLERPWEDELFDDCLNNITGIQKENAKAILKVWLITVLLREGLVSRPILALYGMPGCLGKDTPITIKRGMHTRTMTIKELHDRFNNKWDSTLETRIASVKNDVVGWRSIRAVISSGSKETYIVKVHGQEPFRVTKDHRFLTRNGYKRLEDLHVGDFVLIKGDYLQPSVGIGRIVYTSREEVSAKYHPHARMRMVGKYGPYGRIYKYRAVYEAEINGLTLQQYCWIINKNKERAATLTYLPSSIVIHHKDENPYNNDFDNLEIKKKLDHDREHGHANQKNLGEYSGLWETVEARIESIELYGEEETYDIEMEDDEAPNFLVNNVVVHNSGKSTLFRRIYTLIYGRERGLNSVSKEEHFDYAMARDALVVLDNVDTYAKWLPDRLAVTISPTEIIKRKLFTDSDTVVLRRQAMLGITAHDPKFTRVDVTDRLLLLNFERLEHFKPENQILERIESLRGSLWGAILQDIQKILGCEVPRTGFPQFRIEDFAQFGYWIATSLGIGQEFYNGIEEVRKSQRSMNLEEDVTLILAIDRYLSRENGKIEGMGAGTLWQRLKSASGDDRAFDRKYGNAVSLSRKLWTLLETLKEVFEVDWKIERGSRVWTIRKKIEVGTNGHAEQTIA